MTLLNQRPDVGEFRRRFVWLALAVVALVGVLLVKLFSLQVVRHGELASIARDNIVHKVTLATSRGVVRDRKGVVLAASRESWNVYVVPARLDIDKTWPRLADILGLGPVERAMLEQKVRQARVDDLAALKANPNHRIKELVVREDVSRDVVGTLETRASELPAVSWLSVPLRYYPAKDLAFHLLGYVNEVNREDLVAHPDLGLQPGDRVGRSGIERSWESYLRGQRGWKKNILDARGARRTTKEDLAHIDDPRELPPVPGRDVRLTIDADLTAAARRAFAGQLAGAVVAVEVKTGRLLTVYSKPAVDPNDFVAGLTTKQAEAITQNVLRPLIDKTMYESYFPGSTIKPFAALAALRARVLTPKTEERCEHIYVLGKTRFKCEGYHGQIELHDAIVRSCNIYFYHLGERIGLDGLAAMEREFGFGERTGVGVSFEQPGLIPTKAWYSQHYGGQYRGGYTLNAAIGQGNTKVTVLQLAMAYAALANGGRLFAPQAVRAIESSDGIVDVDFPPRLRRQINVAPDHLRAVVEAMHGVVSAPGGTAYAERSARIDVAGKTGTAQVSHIAQKSGVDPHSIWYFNRDHAWFGGFAPYDDPEIAVVVLVEHGGGGGHNAAPIAMRVFEEYFGRIKPAIASAAPPAGGKAGVGGKKSASASGASGASGAATAASASSASSARGSR